MNNYIILGVVILILVGGYAYMKKNPSTQKPQGTQNEQPTETSMKSIKTEDITVGTGAEAVKGKTVSVQYKGTLKDGTEFDSSYSRNSEPLVYTVQAGQMIPGFDEGVVGMKVGGVRKITIPPQLGYGDRAVGPIPANSTLIFEVKLEKVE